MDDEGLKPKFGQKSKIIPHNKLDPCSLAVFCNFKIPQDWNVFKIKFMFWRLGVCLGKIVPYFFGDSRGSVSPKAFDRVVFFPVEEMQCVTKLVAISSRQYHFSATCFAGSKWRLE